jgi:hypothetical protein
MGLLILEVSGQECGHMEGLTYLSGIEIGAHVLSGGA